MSSHLGFIYKQNPYPSEIHADMFTSKIIWYWEFASEDPEWVEIEGKQDLVELVIVRAGDVYVEF